MYELQKIEKHFPGVHALKSVDFTVEKGEIVGLVGENGAGKSTLMKVIYGAYQPDGGTVTIDGKPMRFANPRQARFFERVPRQSLLFPPLVAERPKWPTEYADRPLPWAIA